METTGPLVGHVRRGRVYLTPLADTGVLHEGDWVRDDLPDLIWPIVVLAELGSHAAVKFVRWQDAVQRDLAEQVEPVVLGESLDGRLTSLDRLVDRVPEAAFVIRGRAIEHGLLSEHVVRVLSSYPARPASWLTGSETVTLEQDDVDLLARAVLEVLKDGHREAIVKCLSIWSSVQAGSFSSDAETIELLKVYPNDLRTRGKTDSVVRACWGASDARRVHLDPHFFGPSIRWAKVFWGVNSMTTACVRRRELGDETPVPDAGTSPTSPPEAGAHLRRLAMDLLSSYFEALETAPSRLYDNEEQEVHSALVARAGREVVTALAAPDLWCMEHGAHVIRLLVEVRIYLAWMARQDRSIYRTFQEYGAGKAKLYSRIMGEVTRLVTDQDVVDAVDELERLSHNHEVLDHRIVDTRDSFAGKSIRGMAEEVGLLDLYRHAYYLASGVAHSEWWSLETHCMERCLNVLHRGHLIPSLSLAAGGNIQLAQSWVDQLYALMRFSTRVLRTDESAVRQAFSWLDSGDDSASPPDRDE